MEKTPALTPFRVQKFLGGLRYPARKDDVLGRARAQGADARVLGVLEQIPDCEYCSPVALSREIGGRASPRAARDPKAHGAAALRPAAST